MTLICQPTRDAAILSELYQRCFNKKWPIDDLTKHLTQPTVYAEIALLDNQAAGLSLWQVATENADLWYIATLPHARKSGVANALWRSMCTRLTQQHIATLLIEVSTANQAASEFYRKMGCSQLSIRKNYYRNHNGSRDDALLLQYQLT